MAMHKVFLVEDEIVAREGIRDNVDWHAVGFEFCGEAPDGELALPLIEATLPDVVITDIKMPFMDGLQLSRLVKERFPGTKIIILSGHDEFQYAQEAIKLGVTEYLLKPISVRELHDLLQRVGAQLAAERAAVSHLHQLQLQANSHQDQLREQFLLKLISRDVTVDEADRDSRLLSLDIAANFYQVVVFLVGGGIGVEAPDYANCERWVAALTQMAEHQGQRLKVQKDLDEVVLILSGESHSGLEENLTELQSATQLLANGDGVCPLHTGIGPVVARTSDVRRSYAEAVLHLREQVRTELRTSLFPGPMGAQLLLLNRAIMEDLLRFGDVGEVLSSFDEYVAPLAGATLESPHLLNYLLTDVAAMAMRQVRQWGGSSEQGFPLLEDDGAWLRSVQTVDELRRGIEVICRHALRFRDGRAASRYGVIVQNARDYIAGHLGDAALGLQDVAGHVGLSPSHFSTIFSSETGETFKEYMTRLRIDRAKELLRSTPLSTAEIGYQIGYSDPHYFGAAFKRETGLSPRQFRGGLGSEPEENATS
jgi:two-component system response regulator YesN